MKLSNINNSQLPHPHQNFSLKIPLLLSNQKKLIFLQLNFIVNTLLQHFTNTNNFHCKTQKLCSTFKHCKTLLERRNFSKTASRNFSQIKHFLAKIAESKIIENRCFNSFISSKKKIFVKLNLFSKLLPDEKSLTPTFTQELFNENSPLIK